MTYYYDRESLPEVVKNEKGQYSVGGSLYDQESEETIQGWIDELLALLHFRQDENDEADDEFTEPTFLDHLIADFNSLVATLRGFYG